MQTAIQELIEIIYERPTEISQFNASQILELIEPLLEKEKEQIKDACNYGCRYGYSTNGEEYYNQTYTEQC